MSGYVYLYSELKWNCRETVLGVCVLARGF